MKTLFEKIVSNTLFSFVSWLIIASTSFITAPLIIGRLGFELYGLWVAFFILIGYLNLLDLGFGAAITRNLAYLKAKNKKELLSPFITFAFAYYLLVFVVALIVFHFGWHPVVKLLRLPPALWSTFRSLLKLAALYFLFERFHLIFAALFNGLQKMYLGTIGTLITSVGFLLGTLLMVKFDKSLTELASILITGFALVLVYDLIALKRSGYGQLKLAWPSWQKIRKFLAYGFQIQLTITLDQFSVQTFKVLVSALFGLGALAFYELAYRLLLFLKSLTKLILPAMFPTIAEIAADNQKEKILNLAEKASRYLVVLTGLFYVGAGFLANDFFLFWLKEDLPMVIFAVRILLLGYFLDTIMTIISTVLMSLGWVNVQLTYMFWFTTISLGLAFLLGKVFGFNLMIFSYFLASLLASPILWRGFTSKIGQLRLGFWLKTLIKTLLAAFSSGLLISLISLVLTKVSIITFLIKGTIFVTSYFAVLFLLCFFNSEDRIVLSRLISFFNWKSRRLKRET